MDEKYTNALVVNVSYYDVVTKFYRETHDFADGKEDTTVEEVVKLRMSIQLAKAYYEILGDHIAGYEKMYGVIPKLPQNLNKTASMDSEIIDEAAITRY